MLLALLVTAALCCLESHAITDPVTGIERERIVCPDKSLVYGPGLEPNFRVPARFFFIQAIDTEGKSFSYSPGPNAFEVTIQPRNKRGRIWTQLLDRNDGTFIVRFRMYASYDNLEISVKSGRRHVADSPYVIKGHIYHETCYCPTEDDDAWLQDMKCDTSLPPQAERDLSIFPSVDLDRLAEEAPSRFNRHSLCHYTIIDNKIYRKTHGEHVGFKMFMDSILLSITRKVRLPDMEFFVNLGDWPLEKRKPEDSPLPILSWCGSRDTRDIVMPTYDLTESALETMGRVTLDMLSVQGNTDVAWENKTDKGFWRGRDSRRERLNLVKLSREHPNLIDAALTNFFFFRDEMEEYGPKVPHISFFDFFKFKYQINMDGTVAAYRFPYLMAGNSVVFKHESEYYEHFYQDLQEGVHYVPFKKDLSNIIEKIEWAKQHDDEVRQIAQNAQQFARDNLMSNDVFCYYFKLLREFAKRQNREAKIYEGMEEVHQPEDKGACRCHHLFPPHDEF
ncbi:protein O-glucosyltransferase 2-like [Ptychodera flava]|uniref:protein O-glucosyltransferase 2-like n=1 Tax=Ptychodera flava TaxID=63121 RepID=UPI00396A1796